MKKTKHEIRFDIVTISAIELEGDFTDLIPMITDTKKYLKENQTYWYVQKENEIELCHKFSFYHNYGYDGDSDEFNIQGHRWETDEEFGARLRQEKEDAKAALEKKKQKEAEEYLKELEIYEKLKKKFGG